jgi:hypothetical protein
MPHFGTQDVKAAAAARPRIENLQPVSWAMPGASMLQLTFEIQEGPADTLIAPALHPSIPPYAAFNILRAPESPVGPFALAELRVVARAGIRPRGYLVSSFASSGRAATALTEQWGFGAEVADVSLQSRHDRWVGHIERDGDPLLHIELEDPEPVAPGDVPLVASLHLVRARSDTDEDEALILQLDRGYEIARADRGRPELLEFDTAALRAEGLVPTDPMVAVALEADVDFSPFRFAMSPTLPAVQGTRRVDR